jgi:outer membrane protein assembly factor BamB
MRFSPSLQISAFLTAFVYLFTIQLLSQTEVRAESGLARCWAYELRESVAVAVAYDKGEVFAGMSDGKLEALSRVGQKIWSADFGGTLSSNLVISDNSVVVATSPSNTHGREIANPVIRSLSKETGITQWTRELTAAERFHLYPFKGSIIVVSKSGSIRAIEGSSGRLLWNREITSGFVSNPFVSGSNVVVAGRSGQIFKVSLATGEIDEMRKHPGNISSVLITSAGSIIVGDERGNIISLPVGSDKSSWRFKSGGQISALLEFGNEVIAVSHDNFVYSLSGRNGDVIWKRRFSGRVVFAAKAFQNYAILSGIGDNGASLIALNTGKVANEISLQDNEELVSDPISTDRSAYIATTRAVYGYALHGCVESEEGGSGQK